MFVMTESVTMTKRRRRSFSAEFKAEVVELCRQPGRNPASVAAELDLTETAVWRWPMLMPVSARG
jgi:transposase